METQSTTPLWTDFPLSIVGVEGEEGDILGTPRTNQRLRVYHNSQVHAVWSPEYDLLHQQTPYYLLSPHGVSKSAIKSRRGSWQGPLLAVDILQSTLQGLERTGIRCDLILGLRSHENGRRILVM